MLLKFFLHIIHFMHFQVSIFRLLTLSFRICISDVKK